MRCNGPLTVAKLSQSTIARDFIGQLMSRCSLGCAWTGKLEDRQGHLENTCGHKLTPCQFCGEDIKRMALDEHHDSCHAKPISCPHHT